MLLALGTAAVLVYWLADENKKTVEKKVKKQK